MVRVLQSLDYISFSFSPVIEFSWIAHIANIGIFGIFVFQFQIGFAIMIYQFVNYNNWLED